MSQPIIESFIHRPSIGDRFLSPNGEILSVGAIWEGGVVWEGVERCTSAGELGAFYKPECPQCATFHEPEYPHELTSAFRLHISMTQGRTATREDTYSHCTGLLRDAVIAAHQHQENAA